jgi:NIPSNAP
MPEPVLDIRTYTIRPRGVPEFVRLWEEFMLPVALKHWGKPAAFYVSEIGPLNQVIHIWEFESCRSRRRTILHRYGRHDSCPRGPHCPAREFQDAHWVAAAPLQRRRIT